MLTRSHDSIRLRQALQVEHEQLRLHDMSVLSGLAHFVASPHNRYTSSPFMTAKQLSCEVIELASYRHTSVQRPPKPDGMEEQDFFGIEKLRGSSLNFLADKEL